MSVFKFRQFDVAQSGSVHKVGTDSMILGALLNGNPNTVLDIGTGTGVLALMAAQQFPKAIISAVEVEQEAFQLASLNFSNAPFSEQLNLFHVNFLQWNTTTRFDLIVCNPPYFKSSMLSPDEVRANARHEMNLGFTSLLVKAKKLLSETGAFWCIIPFDRLQELRETADDHELFVKSIFTIFGKPNHPKRSIVVMQIQQVDALIEEKLTVRNEKGQYTDEYIQLTKDFHNKSIAE